MPRFAGWLYSPRDALAVLECQHRLLLEHALAHGLLSPPAAESDALQLIADFPRAVEFLLSRTFLGVVQRAR